MRAFNEAFERSVRERNADYIDAPTTEAAQFITPEVLRGAQSHPGAAERAAVTEPVKERVNAVRRWFPGAGGLGELIALHDRHGRTMDESLLPRLRELYALPTKRWREGTYEGRRLRELGDLAGAPWEIRWSGADSQIWIAEAKIGPIGVTEKKDHRP